MDPATPHRRATDLQNFRISVGDIIKALIVAGPCVATVGSAIWYFSAWTEKVNLRLDDMDRDLKQLHDLYLHRRPAYPSLENYRLRH